MLQYKDKLNTGTNFYEIPLHEDERRQAAAVLFS